MLSTEQFSSFAKQVVLFLHNTSHVDDEPYPNLLSEKGANAYPTVPFLDGTGRVLTEQPYPTKNAGDLQRTFDSLQAWKRLRAKVESQDGGGKTNGLAKKLFFTELEFGMLQFAEASARAKGLTDVFTDADKTSVDKTLITMEFQSILRTVDRSKQETAVAAGKKFLAMIEKNRIPKVRQITSFWMHALDYAYDKKDADLFEKIWTRAQKEMGDDSRVRRYKRIVEGRLAELRGDGK